MSFAGRVSRESHEGGLLVSFEGKAPRLGARIRISGGRILGKVDTVIGNTVSPLIHVHPLYDGINPRASIGSPVEIAPRDRTPRKSRNRANSSKDFRGRDGSRNSRQRKGGQRTVREKSSRGRSERDRKRPGKGQKGPIRGLGKGRRRSGSGSRRSPSNRFKGRRRR